MKALYFLALLLAAGALGLVGCNKAPKAPPPPQIQGVTVDTPKLQAALSTNQTASVQEQMTQFLFGLRYGDYVKALMALDKLTTDPAVTEEQKKVVNEVIEQVKQVVNQQQKPPQ